MCVTSMNYQTSFRFSLAYSDGPPLSTKEYSPYFIRKELTLGLVVDWLWCAYVIVVEFNFVCDCFIFFRSFRVCFTAISI